jgi:hypothetical protein
MSDLEARHSRNIAARPQVAIVIFDSHEADRRVEGRLPLGFSELLLRPISRSSVDQVLVRRILRTSPRVNSPKLVCRIVHTPGPTGSENSQ